jgi:gliding motility-associated-like protein
MLNMPPKLPLPDGNAFISIQNNTYITPRPEPQIPKSYVGQCMQAPLKKGEDYTLSFYAGRFKSWDNLTGKIFPFTVALFGNADCNAVPFGKAYASGNGCPANYSGWVFLGKTTVYSSGSWVQTKIRFTPSEDINIIEVGPDCSVLPPINDLTDSTTFLDYHIYYLDDMYLLPTKDFPFQYIHTQTGVACNGLPELQAPVFTNAVYQWYKDSVAIYGATGDTYNVTDTSGINYYNVLITTPGKCITSEPFLVTASRLNQIKIPADTVLCVNDTILLSPALPGITYIINGLTNSEVKINAIGDYTIVATDVYGCQKIFNTNITQQNCADCTIYVPSAFTPNGDGLNDVFKPKLNCLSYEFHCTIFNRWGEKIFETNDINKGWDGNYSGSKLSAGSYVYYINYKTSTGINKSARGVVVLIF